MISGEKNIQAVWGSLNSEQYNRAIRIYGVKVGGVLQEPIALEEKASILRRMGLLKQEVITK